MNHTPQEERDIAEAIATVEAAKNAKGKETLEDSAMGLARLFVDIMEVGVPKEYILDIIRLPFMFASLPDKPEVVADAVGNIDAVDRSN